MTLASAYRKVSARVVKPPFELPRSILRSDVPEDIDELVRESLGNPRALFVAVLAAREHSGVTGLYRENGNEKVARGPYRLDTIDLSIGGKLDVRRPLLLTGTLRVDGAIRVRKSGALYVAGDVHTPMLQLDGDAWIGGTLDGEVTGRAQKSLFVARPKSRRGRRR